MTLIIILIALVFDRFAGVLPALRSMNWFDTYREKIHSSLPSYLQSGMLGVLSILLPMVAGVLLLNCFIDEFVHGLAQIIFCTLVLFYCLGSSVLNQQIEGYLDARKAGQPHDAKNAAVKLAGASNLHENYAESTAVTMSILYRSVVDVFAILFWFVILGPAGALLYRLATHLLSNVREANLIELESAADTFWGLLGWLPFRLVALTYFLAGNFEDSLASWKESHKVNWEFSKTNLDVVTNTGCGAIQHEVGDNVSGKKDPRDDDLQWVGTARHLVFRSLIIWCAVIAILTLAEWFV